MSTREMGKSPKNNYMGHEKNPTNQEVCNEWSLSYEAPKSAW